MIIRAKLLKDIACGKGKRIFNYLALIISTKPIGHFRVVGRRGVRKYDSRDLDVGIGDIDFGAGCGDVHARDRF